MRGKAPVIEVDLTDYGYQYAGVRPLDEASIHVRTYHLILPFHQIRPSQTDRGFPLVAGHMWVPMDDETTMVYNWEYSPTDEPLSDEDRHEIERRLGNGPHDVDQDDLPVDRAIARTTTCWIARCRRRRASPGSTGSTRRTAPSRRAWAPSSIAAASTSGPADRAVIQARRLLLEAVRTTADGGTPRGVAPTYYSLSAAEAVLPRGANWRELPAHDAARLSAAPR